MASGAQAFLIKGEYTRDRLAETPHHALNRHTLLARLRSARAEVGEANTTIDEIRGVLAHDLRAPVRSARLFADWVIANVPNLSPITAEAAHHLDKSLDVLRLRDVAHHSIEIDPEIQVRAHPELLMRVLSNLMTNSIRYRRDGVPCEITISAATDEDRDIVRLGADG